MNTASKTIVANSAQTRLIALAAAGFLGLFIVGFAGFAPMEVVHNAAHDFRHSMGFPCH